MGPKAMNDDRADQKYELTARSCEVDGRTLRQIRALRDVAGVGRGDFGGWLESEDNLSQEGDCWVGDAARVYAEARVTGCAVVDGAARVVDRARVEGFAWVTGAAVVSGEALVVGSAFVEAAGRVSGEAVVGIGRPANWLVTSVAPGVFPVDHCSGRQSVLVGRSTAA